MQHFKFNVNAHKSEILLKYHFSAKSNNSGTKMYQEPDGMKFLNIYVAICFLCRLEGLFVIFSFFTPFFT